MLEIIGRFVLHMIVGTTLFAVVAGFAVVVWEGTQWLGKVGVPYYISVVAEGVAILLFGLDILCLLLFVIVETVRLLRLMWRQLWI
jgi:hypothetical protein